MSMGALDCCGAVAADGVWDVFISDEPLRFSNLKNLGCLLAWPLWDGFET